MSTDVFSATVKVFANDGSDLNRGEFSIAFSLSPSGSLTGTLTGSTSNLQLKISNFKVSTSGTYNLVAAGNGLISGNSESFTIAAKVLSEISITSDHDSPSCYFSFKITCKLYDQSVNLWDASSLVSVTSSPGVISGNSLTATVTSGIADFNVYASATGSVTVYCKSGSVTGSLTLDILQDLIKINSVSPDVNFN